MTENLTLPKEFKVQLCMASDWHVGSGTGIPRNIDKLLIRDHDDFPFVPAKTLIGIWRDACERLALGLDNNDENGDWSKLVDKIFGNQPALTKQNEIEKQKQTPNKALLQISPARLPSDLREVLKGDNRRILRDSLTFIKPGVKIDKQSGTSVTDMLRFEEMGRMDTILHTGCEIDWNGFDEQARRWMSALLIGGAKFVERIGGKRRRGAGKCQLSFVDLEADITKIIEELRAENPSANPSKSPPSYDVQAVEIKSDEWVIIPFRVELEMPVAIVSNTLGNVAESLDYVPGTYFLPYFTRKFNSPIFRQAVASGDVQVLPATIEVAGERGLFVPRSLSANKVDGSFLKERTVFNRFCDATKDRAQQKPYRTGYIGSFSKTLDNGNGQLPAYKLTPKVLLTHNTVEDKLQRPSEEVGGVYSREAIAGGTLLRSELRLRKEVVEALNISDLSELAGKCRIGTSSKDDYGLVRIEILGDEKKEASPANCRASSLTTKNGARLLTVCLLSDVLLRTGNLRQTGAEEVLEALVKKLKLTQPDLSLKEHRLTPAEEEQGLISSLLAVGRIESWHDGWNRPRPSFIPLLAGSCAVFEVENIKDETEFYHALARLELAGIGERRGEGYGQICFNSLILTAPVNHWKPASKLQDSEQESPTKLKEGDRNFVHARQIEKTAWRKVIERKVLRIADSIADSKPFREHFLSWEVKNQSGADKDRPNSTQAGSLRSALQRLERPNDVKVIGWLDHLEATQNRKDKWTAKTLEVLRDILISEEKIWEILQEQDRLSFPPEITENSKAALKESLWTEAVKSLFDACVRAHKREIGKERQKNG